MSKIPRGFVPLDMNYLRNGKIRRAGPDAELLFIRSLAFCKSSQTQGFIADYDLDVVGVGLQDVSVRAYALVREQLWIRVDGGYQVKGWEEWNGTQDEATDKKRAAAVKTNHDRWHVAKGKVAPDCALCAAPMRLVR